MIIPDVNLLLYATIDGFPQHRRARDWWRSLLDGTHEVGLTAPAIFGFVRIATNRKVLATPLDPGEAIGYVRQWRSRRGVRVLEAGPGHCDIALELLETLGTAANLTTDAQIAAYAIESGGEVHSADTDFDRFPHVRWSNPLQ